MNTNTKAIDIQAFIKNKTQLSLRLISVPLIQTRTLWDTRRLNGP